MKKVYLAIIIILNFFIQTSFLEGLNLFGIPDSDLLVTLFTGIFLGPYYGAVVGLIIGFLQDILFSKIVGLSSLSLFIMGIASGYIKENFITKKKIYRLFLLCLVATIVYNFIYYLVGYFFNSGIVLNNIVRNRFVGSLIFNLIIAYPLYILFKKLFETKNLNFY